MNTIVVAYDQLRTIGKEGSVPWLGELPVDMKFFRDTTLRKPVIMGRKTYESLPEVYRPLPNRENIVLSLSGQAIAGARIAASLEEAYALAKGRAHVIGGASVYEQALPFTDRIIATEIETETEGGDAFFPTLPDEHWVETHRRHFSSDARNAYSGSFVTYMSRNFLQRPASRSGR